MTTYGAMIRQWRSEKRWSQRALAKALGCSDGYIALIEGASKVPSLDLCIALIHVLQLKAQDEKALLAAVEDARQEDAEQRVRMRRDVARGVMRVEFLEQLPLDNFVEEIPSAQRICILETFTNLVNDDATYKQFTEAITAALQKDAIIHVLLIDPNSYGAKQRARELARAAAPITNVIELMELTLARFYRLQNELGEYEKHNKFAVKLYDASPSIALHMWDDEAYLSFFPVDQRSDYAPNLKLSMLNRLGEYIYAKFNELWDQKESIFLKKYMEMYAKIHKDYKLFYFKIEENRNKQTLYAVCKYDEEDSKFLKEKTKGRSLIDFSIKGTNYRGKIYELTLKEEKGQIIEDIIKKYDWNERDREHYLGHNPELFYIQLPNKTISKE